MAAVSVTINGVIIDYYGRTIMGPVKIVGELMRSDVGVGGGPIIPPDKPPEPPLGIWPGPGDPDYPIRPPGQVPTPPDVHPGDPTTPVPPPPGRAGWPVNPITPPPYIVVNYPGIGPVYVAPPASSSNGGSGSGGGPGAPGNFPPQPTHPDTGIPHPGPV